MKRAPPWLVSVLIVGALGSPVHGADEALTPAQPQDKLDELMVKYNLHPAFEKLGRGVSNALGGWLEVPLNIHKHYTANDTAASWFTGLAHGLFRGAVRTGVGLYETVTFFLPYPEDYAPILPTLEYFQKGSKREPLPLE